MNIALVLSFLFFMGSIGGWIVEVFFRKFLSKSNPERKWINPGFCVGPYLPIYGFGLVFLFFLAEMLKKLTINNEILYYFALFIVVTFALTVIEYLAGLICLKIFKIRLWDYSMMKINLQGLICPLFSLIWGALGTIYCVFAHMHIINTLIWLSNNLAFSFFIGLFFGFFILDVIYSANLISKIRNYAKENNITVKLVKFKVELINKAKSIGKKVNFLFPLNLHKLITAKIKERRDEKNKLDCDHDCLD